MTFRKITISIWFDKIQNVWKTSAYDEEGKLRARVNSKEKPRVVWTTK